MSYGNAMLVKSFRPEAAVLPYRFVKFGATDDAVVQGAAAADLIIGVSNVLGATADDVTRGNPVDVTLAGIAELTLGASVTRGQRLMSDATGRGILATSTNMVGAIALRSGAANDVVPVLVIPSIF